MYRQGSPGSGIGGLDLNDPHDLAFALDLESSGRQDYLCFYRPSLGTFWCLKNVNGSFSAVVKIGSPGNGLGGYDLSDPRDQSFAYDWDSSGKNDHVVFYRPGRGTFWCLRNLRNGRTDSAASTAVHAEGPPGKGLGGYDVVSGLNTVFAFDYSKNGHANDLFMYRRDGSGTAWILTRG